MLNEQVGSEKVKEYQAGQFL